LSDHLPLRAVSKYSCMTLMLDNALLRRLVTVTSVYVGFVFVTALLPLILVASLLVDLIRRVIAAKPFMATRMLVFGWLYLFGEVWGLFILGVTAPLPRARAIEATYRLQCRWAAWNFRAVRLIFGLRIVADGQENVAPGPVILLSRHASLIDTLLPSWFVTREIGMTVRYVLKKELLLDPALDVAGNRLPNHFVDRGAVDNERDLDAIRELGSDLSEDEAVLIYPEGTRFSEQKRDRYLNRFAHRTGRVAEIASSLRSVLPPRPGGTLALLEGSTADVVLLAHRGLEGFARVKDMWKGGIVGSRIDVIFRRIARAEIPEGRTDRVTWLFETWRDVDVWVTGEEPVAGLA
jgi:1-acyl-sn-glycerol-3-phosphate acyltransferase